VPRISESPFNLATTVRNRISLERALSKLGLVSRTEARALIEAGRVTVDGRVITNPRHSTVPERAAIAIDGTRQRQAEPVTVLLHKPRGVVTTRSDPQGRPTVFDLLTDLDAHVVPVGRLDWATSGLLLLTNDTRLADWLTDPRTAIPRVYLVTVRGRVTAETVRTIVHGRVIDGEHLSADDVRVRKASSRETHLVVTLREGKNREIRRLFEAVGHPVTRLRRVQFGALELHTLPPGRWRVIGTRELDEVFPGRPPRRKRYNR
jgi:23S rRNA pseudouridine2605 synthase